MGPRLHSVAAWWWWLTVGIAAPCLIVWLAFKHESGFFVGAGIAIANLAGLWQGRTEGRKP
jgi:hypothetical protein